MMVKILKGIKIDVVKREIFHVEYVNLNDIYSLLDCRCFCIAASKWIAPDHLYVDDDGLLRDVPLGFFMIAGNAQPLSGHGLIVGCDLEGDGIDCVKDIDSIRKIVRFDR
ncbi:MAG: hypothetical protein WKF87_06645 [Chryseolinea sp.]